MSDSQRERAWKAHAEYNIRLNAIAEHRMKAEVGLAMADFSILSILNVSPNQSLRMGTLAEVLAYSPSRLSYLVSSLVDRKLVKKTTSSSDGRGYVATLTPTGRVLWDRADEIQHEVFTEYIVPMLSKEDHENLIGIFNRIADHLEFEMPGEESDE
ncbi:MAG: MarR family winged helix-turn-helix transcriptional regulator [Actinomycetaceae bacterium]|nr:MarR family winged helix-turn-helix transcriptional regulator [Actinomycetaceae bacterium]